MEQHREPPFYGIEIIRRKEQAYIKNLLKKYKNEPVNDALKQKIWDELQMEKHLGNLTIPFKVVMRRDASGVFPEFVEVILDSKV
ncbi:MAG: hypothetical protein H0X51_01060 [Parachlamydiaceae bacterium]|nr:hypothetical protein [Parachlamydiaceae bacterium]